VVQRLSRELQAILAMPEVKKRLLELSLDAQGSTPEQASELLSQDIRRWTEVIAKSKIEKH
jgi:tripartite-type tricarboxylate transporter receptor subunit TctC